MFHSNPQQTSTPTESSGRSFRHDISNNLPLRPNTYNWRLFPSLFTSETSVLAAKIQTDPLSTQLLSFSALVNRPTPEHMWTIANNYSSLFDALFFHSSLTLHLSIVFQPMNIEGYYSHTNTTIYISSNVSWERAKVGHAGSEHLSTLLHEMMHAFFHFWGDATLMQIPAKEGVIGKEGHGRVRANCMILVEGAWNLLHMMGVVGFMVNCVVFDSVRISMFQEGWRASVEEMKRWGADDETARKWGPGGEWGEPNMMTESMRAHFAWVVG